MLCEFISSSRATDKLPAGGSERVTCVVTAVNKDTKFLLADVL